MRVLDTVFAAGGVALLVGSGVALAQQGGAAPMQDGERRADDGRGIAAADAMTLGEAVARAGALGYGPVREAEYEHGRYEIETVDATGRRVELYLDAVTGELLKIDHDD